jgi:hypothetical protein
LLVGALIAASCGGTTDSNVSERTGRAENDLISLSWVSQGPAPMRNGQATLEPTSNMNPVTGAINSVAPHPTNANILYAGTVNGGVWVTNNALATNPSWTPLTDKLPSLSIGSISLDPANPQVVAAVTGRWSSFSNDGGTQGQVLVSKNAGQTWSVSADPLFFGQKGSGIAIRGNTIVATFIDGVGLVRSIDGGAHWTQISGSGTGLPSGTVDQLVPDQSVSSRLYVTLSGVGVFRSEDVGTTWVNISQNDPNRNGLNAKVLSVNPGSSATKASVCNDGRVYVGVLDGFFGDVAFVGYSIDHGQTWVDMDVPALNGRGNPFFHFALLGDPSNSGFVYVGGISSWQRGNAGIQPTGQFNSPQWSDIAFDGTPNFTSPHDDTRNFVEDANLDLIMVGDGGIFKRVRPRETTGDWFSLAGNLQLAEIHDIAYDANSNIVLGGTQDNGTVEQITTGQLPWTTFEGGDGGDVAVDVLSNPGFSIRYTSFQGLGGFTRTTYNANNVQVSAIAPLLQVSNGGPVLLPEFDTPVVLNKVNPKRLLLGGINSVYESFDQGDTITFLGAAGNPSEMAYGHPANVDVIYVADEQVFVRLTATGALAQTPAPFPTGDARGVVIDSASFRTAYVVGLENVS